ncbi:MAG TPA: NADP-dependent isocitrate dehydrogenase, partial [Sulfurovum sp.]|nr:NADP-dependent isocitrate dehydrogenase [Sulfurovum sp.]
MSKLPKIIWSKIDEAPALATYSLLPIVNVFTQAAGVSVVESDISLAGRILAAMDLAPDELSKLGEVVLEADGNIIKLPNISASVGQLIDCITELQGQGYDIPNYPENPANADEEATQAKYAGCLGSAVNP